jgi:hypothetical protein
LGHEKIPRIPGGASHRLGGRLLRYNIASAVPASAAAGGGGGVSGNRDTNGDLAIDLSDAVYLLTFLFQGGPPPAEPCPPGAAGGGAGASTDFPKTGLARCFDAAGVEIVGCGDAICPGQDADFSIGCSGNVVDNGDGTVTDNCTSLMWQQDTADTNGGGVDDTDKLSWTAALAYCDGLTFATHSDWRLPNARELESITHYGTVDDLFPRSIDPIFGVLPGDPTIRWYWSSTTMAGIPTHAFRVNFGDGGMGLGAKINTTEHHVRACRGP